MDWLFFMSLCSCARFHSHCEELPVEEELEEVVDEVAEVEEEVDDPLSDPRLEPELETDPCRWLCIWRLAAVRPPPAKP